MGTVFVICRLLPNALEEGHKLTPYFWDYCIWGSLPNIINAGSPCVTGYKEKQIDQSLKQTENSVIGPVPVHI